MSTSTEMDHGMVHFGDGIVHVSQPGKGTHAPPAEHRVLRLVFVRHAQSHNNALEGTNGEQPGRLPDPPITDKGHKEADLVGSYLAENLHTVGAGDGSTPDGKDAAETDAAEVEGVSPPVTRIYTSAMLRAMQTSQHIASQLASPVPVTVWPSIHEVGGCYDIVDQETKATIGVPGMTPEQIREAFPTYTLHDDAGWADGEGWFKGDVRETVPEARERVSHVVRELRSRAAGIKFSQSHVIVAHADLLNLMFQELVAQDKSGRSQFVFFNCSVSAVDLIQGGGLHVVAINSNKHLPGPAF